MKVLQEMSSPSSDWTARQISVLGGGGGGEDHQCPSTTTEIPKAATAVRIVN
jgi:hypothetical protein